MFLLVFLLCFPYVAVAQMSLSVGNRHSWSFPGLWVGGSELAASVLPCQGIKTPRALPPCPSSSALVHVRSLPLLPFRDSLCVSFTFRPFSCVGGHLWAMWLLHLKERETHLPHHFLVRVKQDDICEDWWCNAYPTVWHIATQRVGSYGLLRPSVRNKCRSKKDRRRNGGSGVWGRRGAWRRLKLWQVRSQRPRAEAPDTQKV